MFLFHDEVKESAGATNKNVDQAGPVENPLTMS